MNMGSLSADPIFILSPARSGSTLLRRILDSHQEIACPPESNLAAAFAAMRFTNGILRGDPAAATDETRTLCENYADRTIGEYARTRGKRRWAEKSLVSLDHLDALQAVYPHAQYVCLYRECTDTLISAIEASPWGFSSYGFPPYMSYSADNFALGLASYWADRVQILQEHEHAHPDRCFRLRYEDLVISPQDWVRLVFEFLEVDSSTDAIARCLDFPAEENLGPGDHKIRFTSGVHRNSLGRGWRVPIELIPEPIRQRIDELSASLGYPSLDSDIGESLESEPNAETHTANGMLQSVEAILGGLVSAPSSAQSGAVRLVLPDLRESWIVDFDSRRAYRGSGTSDCTLLTDADTFVSLAEGRTNPAVALRHSQIRVASDVLQSDAAVRRAEGFLRDLHRVEEIRLNGSSREEGV